MGIFALVFLLCCGGLASVANSTGTSGNYSEFFSGREGCFVMYDSTSEKFTRFNPEGCAKRFSPCSTFKIPHTLVALETGVASGAGFTLRWDGIKGQHGIVIRRCGAHSKTQSSGSIRNWHVALERSAKVSSFANCSMEIWTQAADQPTFGWRVR